MISYLLDPRNIVSKVCRQYFHSRALQFLKWSVRRTVAPEQARQTAFRL
ncbi:hypothetical protein BKA00_003978 [Actinomadura coerulea]|uniref:Uncharacterized protein n=1 Tax=Actinomadura coerulea TaxID=46159 RepID=A0A7X0G0P5_9ACTN|nr:hypothetical protein [Actinomadura coerulea]